MHACVYVRSIKRETHFERVRDHNLEASGETAGEKGVARALARRRWTGGGREGRGGERHLFPTRRHQHRSLNWLVLFFYKLIQYGENAKVLLVILLVLSSSSTKSIWKMIILNNAVEIRLHRFTSTSHTLSLYRMSGQCVYNK